MDIFFDVDYTLLGVDGSLRPRSREVFEQLVSDGHKVFIWSGVGVRTTEVRRHELDDLVSGVFQKPIDDYEAGLATYDVTPRPEFVVDDYPGIVRAFGGVVVKPYYFRNAKDDEMDRVYRIICEVHERGHSDDDAFRPRNGTSG